MSGNDLEDERHMRGANAKLRLASETIDEIDVVIKDVSMRFDTREGTVTAVDGMSFRDQARRIRFDHRPVGLRQVNGIQHHGRPCRRL